MSYKFNTQEEFEDDPENPGNETSYPESNLPQTTLKPEQSNDPRIHFDIQLNEYAMTDEDGIDLIWDREKKAWFPRFDNEIIEQQQQAYSEVISKPKEEKKLTKNQMERRSVLLINDSSVYVENLPVDIEYLELDKFFEKAGLLMKDLDTGNTRIKLYTDELGKPKGDALITYYRPDSVALAFTLLDGVEIRPGYPIKISKADFSKKQENQHSVKQAPHPIEASSVDTKTDAVQNKKPKKFTKKQIEAQMKYMEKYILFLLLMTCRQFSWDEEQMSKRQMKAVRTLVLRNVFTPKSLEGSPELLLEIKEDIRSECEKYGEVTSVNLYEKHPEGLFHLNFYFKESCVFGFESL
jgi:HIV Tat-specific factor 1